MVDIQRATHPTKAKKATPVPLSKNGMNSMDAFGLITAQLGLQTLILPLSLDDSFRHVCPGAQ